METRLSRWNSNLLGAPRVFSRGGKETSRRRGDEAYCPADEFGKDRKTGQGIASLNPRHRRICRIVYVRWLLSRLSVDAVVVRDILLCF